MSLRSNVLDLRKRKREVQKGGGDKAIEKQAKMGKFILNLVTGQQKNRDREDLIQIINDFEKKNVDCVALACTDLQLLIPKHPTLKIFDTMKIFADSTVEYLLK